MQTRPRERISAASDTVTPKEGQRQDRQVGERQLYTVCICIVYIICCMRPVNGAESVQRV